MKKLELILIIIPLLLIIIGLIINEFRTGIIPFNILFPTGIYFLIIASIVGQKPWWDYLLGLFLVCIICVLAKELINYFMHSDCVGGGAIKLLVVIGAALGMMLGIQVTVVFIISGAVVSIMAYFIFSQNAVPSSPIILFSVLLVLGFNFGHKLLSKI